MFITIRLIRIILISLVVILLPVSVSAGIYKWVDEHGKTHYTDKPPAKKQGKQQGLGIKLPSKTFSKGLLGTKVATQFTPIQYSDDEPSRRVRLEKLIIDLDNDQGGTLIIGYEHSGASCTRTAGGFKWSKGRSEIEGKEYRTVFEDVLKAGNYQIENTREQLFAEQKRKSAELSVAAVITEMQVNRCRYQRVQYSSKVKDKRKVASYVKVKWSVFDILERKVIYTTTTEGSDSDLYDDELGDGPKISRSKSFSSAVRNLLAKNDFVALLNQTRDISVISEVKQVKNKNLSMALAYGSGKTSFTESVSGLKASTVTIRSVIGHGSGFIISKEGYVITNAHVVGDSAEAIVLINDVERRADVVKVDDRRDVALLKLHNIDGISGLLLSMQQAIDGEPIYIIGTPLDEKYHHTVTRGIVSSHRTFEDGNTYYQTDAAINPGNSGGPAFNQFGEVIGIAVSGLFNRQGDSLDINFLIPISDALGALGVIH